MQGTEVDFRDGKKRVLHFGVRAASVVEHEFGDQPFPHLISTGAGFRFVSYSLWAGLQKSEPGISYDQVCELMDGYLQKTPGAMYTDFLAPIVDAFFAAGILKRVDGAARSPNEKAEPVTH